MTPVLNKSKRTELVASRLTKDELKRLAELADAAEAHSLSDYVYQVLKQHIQKKRA